MDFVKDLGYSEETIEKIINNNLPNVIRQFITDKDNAIKVIHYFETIGVLVIDELLIRRLEIFSVNFDSLKDAIESYNKKVLVALINEDISAINFL